MRVFPSCNFPQVKVNAAEVWFVAAEILCACVIQVCAGFFFNSQISQSLRDGNTNFRNVR